jgi:hypothetical protein
MSQVVYLKVPNSELEKRNQAESPPPPPPPMGPRPAPYLEALQDSRREEALKPKRAVEERMVEMLPSEWLFEEEPLPNKGNPNQVLAIGESIILDTRVNAALRLAHRNKFMNILSHCLWGDEEDSELVRLGYLARGAVMTFQPTNLWELYLVGNIVSNQWKLDRTLRIQKAVFNAQAEKRTAGRHGLPSATWAAMELDDEVMRCQKMLDSSIKSYRLATKRDRMNISAW